MGGAAHRPGFHRTRRQLPDRQRSGRSSMRSTRWVRSTPETPGHRRSRRTRSSRRAGTFACRRSATWPGSLGDQATSDRLTCRTYLAEVPDVEVKDRNARRRERGIAEAQFPRLKRPSGVRPRGRTVSQPRNSLANHRPVRSSRTALPRRARQPAPRSTRRRAAPLGPDRARGAGLGCRRVERSILLMGPDLHRLARDRRRRGSPDIRANIVERGTNSYRTRLS